MKASGDLHFGDDLSEITPDKLAKNPELAKLGWISEKQDQVTISQDYDWAIIALNWTDSYTHFDLTTPNGIVLDYNIDVVEDATAFYTRNTSLHRAFYALKKS